MTREVYDRIVEPDAPFEEIEKKPKKSKTIAEYIEEVSGRKLSEWEKEFITNKYMFYKTNRNGRLVARGSAKLDTEPWLAVVFDMYEEDELY